MLNGRFPKLIFKQSALPILGCETCVKPLELSRVEPASSRFDLQTFGCKTCCRQETLVVELDCIKIHESGWWERPVPARRTH